GAVVPGGRTGFAVDGDHAGSQLALLGQGRARLLAQSQEGFIPAGRGWLEGGPWRLRRRVSCFAAGEGKPGEGGQAKKQVPMRDHVPSMPWDRDPGHFQVSGKEPWLVLP